MLADIKPQIGYMLQGIAYWMAYKKESSNIDLVEADIVSEAALILSARFSNYYVKKEVCYSVLGDPSSKQHADLGIFSRSNSKCICIIEFKRGDNSGGYIADIKKVNRIKKLNKDIICLVIIAYRKNCSIKVPTQYVYKNGKAKRGIIKTIPNAQVKVRRVCNALESNTCTKMKKVICLEVI